MRLALPAPLPAPRWALTPPFHPYPPLVAAGGLFSAALAVEGTSRFPLPGVTRHRALRSPDFPRNRGTCSPSRGGRFIAPLHYRTANICATVRSRTGHGPVFILAVSVEGAPSPPAGRAGGETGVVGSALPLPVGVKNKRGRL